MKAEILFPDIINLYGELWNGKILKLLLKDNCYFTNYTKQPKFVTEDIDLIYIGPTSEIKQKYVLNVLMSYRKRILELINKGTIFLCVGNGGDYFGRYIDDGTNKILCLNIFDYYTKIDFSTRHNCLFLGHDDELEYVGFKSQFGLLYNIDDQYNWIRTDRGHGNDLTSKYEGFKYNNFYLTNLMGPFLIMNPYFLKNLFQLKNSNFDLYLFDKLVLAYNQRVKEFKDSHTKMI